MRQYWKSAAVWVLFMVSYVILIVMLFKGNAASPFAPAR